MKSEIWFKYLLQLCWFVYYLHDCKNNLSNNCWSIWNILEQLAIITFWLEWKVIERAGHYYSYYHSLARQVPAHPLPRSQERSKNISKEFQMFAKHFKNAQPPPLAKNIFLGNSAKLFVHTGFLLNPETGCVWTFGQTGSHFGHNKNFCLTLFVFPLRLAAASLHLTWQNMEKYYNWISFWTSWKFTKEMPMSKLAKYGLWNMLSAIGRQDVQ